MFAFPTSEEAFLFLTKRVDSVRPPAGDEFSRCGEPCTTSVAHKSGFCPSLSCLRERVTPVGEVTSCTGVGEGSNTRGMFYLLSKIDLYFAPPGTTPHHEILTLVPHVEFLSSPGWERKCARVVLRITTVILLSY